MQSDDPKRSEWAWGECYRQFHQKVWARVFYVIRSVAWLKEPAEATSDITSEVFVSLPSAVRKYQNIGRAEQWLMCVAVRKALRYKESITGSWSQGRNMAGKKDVDARYGVRRVRVDLEGAVEQAMVYLDSVEERDCRIELSRRLGSWSKNPSKQRWVAFVKLFLEGYGHAEIAGRLGITPATSRTWLWKIRQELGSVFQPRNELA
jgi:RNA polymerase sigma factor (sigma-70 family)